MSNFELSAIICTHNPRPHYLRRVLDALKAQLLTKEQWELLLVDNASNEPLEKRVDLSWHPHSRHIREDNLGLTAARLRGIGDSCGQLLVFVDDDNILAENYLENALSVTQTWPQLGVWGGRVDAAFETPPPEWTRRYLGMLAIRAVERDVWSNSTSAFDAMPCGAGMVVRRAVCKDYAARVAKNPLRATLDRKGEDLASCGDTDIVYAAVESGYGFGLFRSLRVTHLIPQTRLTKAYFVRLTERMAFSMTLLQAAHEPTRGNCPEAETGLRRLYTLVRNRQERTLFFARRRGIRNAARILAQHRKSHASAENEPSRMAR